MSAKVRDYYATETERFDPAAWQRNRRRMIAYGRWQPTVLVSPDAARAHVHALRDFGLSVRALGTMLGRDSSILSALVYPGHARYSSAITQANEARILALRFDLDALLPDAQVPNCGTRRRIEALAFMGWSAGDIASRLGVGRAAVKSYRQTCPSSSRTRVKVSTARAIRDIYDEWSMTQGPSRKAADWARARGWLGPLAWDDDTIDDPDATPDVGTDTLTPSQRHAENVADLLASNPLATLSQLAERLGLTANGLHVALVRAGADGLRERLNRNAELEGHTVRRAAS